MATEDKRQFKRVPSTTRLAFRVLDTKQDLASFHVQAVNMGVGGVFVSSQFLPEPGKLLEIHLMIPTKPEGLRVIGKVRWVDENKEDRGFGVEFYRLADKDREDLLLCCRRGSWMSPPQQQAKGGQ